MHRVQPFALALAAALPACTSVNVDMKDTPPEFPALLAADGYANLDGLRDYDGNIVGLTLLGTGARKGELLHAEIWPFVGVGIGPLGFRVQLLPIDVGVGTLLYAPSRPTGGGEPE